MCFAAKASRGLKLLFPLCLADSASQNNQKLCVIVVAGFGEMAGIYVPPSAPSFTQMARSAALFRLFLPRFTLLHIKAIKLVLLDPTGLCDEVYPSFATVEAWDIVCASSEGSAMMLPLLPYLFSLPFCLMFALSLLFLSLALDFQVMLVYMLRGVCCTLLCLCLSSANILVFQLRARDPGVSRWGEVRKKRGRDQAGEWWIGDRVNGIKKKRREKCSFLGFRVTEMRRRANRKRGKEQSALFLSSFVRFPVNHHVRLQQQWLMSGMWSVECNSAYSHIMVHSSRSVGL